MRVRVTYAPESHLMHEPADCQQCLTHDGTAAGASGHVDVTPQIIYDEYHRWMFGRTRADFRVDVGPMQHRSRPAERCKSSRVCLCGGGSG